MTLGPYWYTNFPDGLYAYDLITFKAGLGGHANTPAELSVTVKTENPDELISSLKELSAKYDDAFLIVEREGSYLQITTGGYRLWDYDFLFMKKVEQLIKKRDIEVMKDHKLADAKMLKLGRQRLTTELDIPQNRWFQLVSSTGKKYNAECSLLRVDCHVNPEVKSAFIDDLSTVSQKANLEVFYYHQKEVGDVINLMLFFTSGRQGTAFTPKKSVDIHSIEDQLESVMTIYGAETGHVGGAEYYPADDLVIERMVDEAFII